MNIKEILLRDIHNVLKDYIDINDIIIEYPSNPEMADYAVPCFGYAKILKKSPFEVATSIKETLNNDWYERVDVVGGYLNVFINKKKLLNHIINEIKNKGNSYGSNTDGENKTVVLDYSAPNIAKPFGVGHLRSTVIGNALKNLFQKNGYKTVSINHLGDYGTQFGKLIYAYLTWGDEEAVRQNPIDELMKLYIKFHEEAKTNPVLEDEGRRYFKLLEDGDETVVSLWKWFKEESLMEFEKTYNLLGIDKFDSYAGESFYNDKMDIVIRELEAKGLLEESEGAYIVNLGEDTLPALIKRSDGASLYMTRDLAAIFYRKKEYNFDKMVYVVGNEQTLHFEQLKKIIEKMNYSWFKDVHHVNFGLILQDGKKMSTRAGKTVKLHDVLLEAVSLAQSYIENRNQDLDNKELVARDIGVGAVIFNDLKNYRTNDINFNLEDILKFEGETGPYIQYTYARINSLLKNKKEYNLNENVIINQNIWNIIFKLYQFNDEVKRAIVGLDPSVIAKYLLDLANLFNKFYASEKIISDNEEETQFKLLVCDAVAIVLKEGLRLLGINAPNKM